MRQIEILDKKRVFDDFFKIDEVRIKYEKFNGEITPIHRRLNFERGDSVAAIVYNEDSKKVILVNQFRYPSYTKGNGWLTEVVAGVLNEGENPETAIKREILEEIGYKTTRLTHISTFFVSPGGTSERIILYYVVVNDLDKTSTGGGISSEHEDIKLIEYTLEELWNSLNKGKIKDAKTIIALMWLKLRK
jgi:ADP-ribose pyrophosphatase